MGRRKYTITEDDHFYARHYLDRKRHDSEWLEDIGLYLDASPVYEAARSDPQALNDGCCSYLTSAHWRPLKDAIRAARRRKKKPEQTTITISQEAWRKLKALAERDRLTLSEALMKYLPDSWEDVPE